MTAKGCIDLILSDLNRYNGKTGLMDFCKAYFSIPGFKFSFYFRLCSYLRENQLRRFVIYPWIRFFFFDRYKYKFGFDIPVGTKIGPGFYIGHFGGIVIHGQTTIGCNCNISQGVTLGAVNRGLRSGVPEIGNNVYIGPGVKIIGKVRVGDNVAIGANAVVTKDCPAGSVMAGVPARVISTQGSEGYISNTDYSK